MPYVRAFPVRCDRFSASIEFNTTDRHDAAAQLKVAGWLPCPRKGGKLTGLCPRCRPPLAATVPMLRTTPDMGLVSDEAAAAVVLWSVRRLYLRRASSPSVRSVARSASSAVTTAMRASASNTRCRSADGSSWPTRCAPLSGPSPICCLKTWTGWSL